MENQIRCGNEKFAYTVNVQYGEYSLEKKKVYGLHNQSQHYALWSLKEENYVTGI
jgi:hypothetical protein